MAAESVVQFVLGKLGDAIVQEIIFLKGVRQQFEQLQKELVSIIGFLRAADAKHSNDPDIRIWVSDVRDIAYDVEDVIDAFFLKCVRREEGCNVLCGIIDWPRKIIDEYCIGKEIEAIFPRIDDISRRRNTYGITSMPEWGETSASTVNNEVRLRRTYAHATDEDVVVVGLEEQISKLVDQLVKKEERRRVITIWGMGGLGKTTLAKRVYHHKDVRQSFDCQAWTFISQEFRFNDVLRNILRQVGAGDSSNPEPGKMAEEDLVAKLSAVLKEKRYLVVLDDIWYVDHWDMLKDAFPRGKSGSKVMLTTRNKAIGEHADPWALHEPRLLTDDEAWDLIRKKVFPGDIVGTSWSVPSELEECGREIALKCRGLPLAVIVLSGILATKKSLMEWETVSKEWDTVSKDISRGKSKVLDMLALSYTDLPYHLKPFFLYLGLFPEDHHISANELIRMWIAESLINEVQGDSTTMEDEGRRHLDELIHRCMVQIVERDLSGRVKKCQLHDKMRDLSIAKGREENFFEIVGKAVGSSEYLGRAAGSRKLRRCVINIEDERMYVFPQHLIPQLRTVFFVAAMPSYSYGLNIMPHDFKLVKVLKVSDVKIRSRLDFSNTIGKLTNLRYLGLRGALEAVDESIGNLVSLQTLDLRYTIFFNPLPNVIWKMRQLRHLHLCNNQSSSLRMNTLTKLQTLCNIKAGDWIADLVHLRNMNKLEIWELTKIQVEKVIGIIVDRLDNLVSLSLGMSPGEGFSNLNKLSRKQNLLSLDLSGKMMSIPSIWPPNITKLILHGSKLKQDPMPTLQMLQNLAHLILNDVYDGKEMVCSENGFPQLRYIEMKNLSHLEEWRVEKGAMPCLTTCEIVNCESLKMVPQGFQFVTTLQNLSLELNVWSNKKLGERVKEGGKDWDVVKKIPFVTVTVKTDLLDLYKQKLWMYRDERG